MITRPFRVAGYLGAGVALAAVLAGGCEPSTTPFPGLALDPTEVSFNPQLGVDLAQMTRSDTGLYYRTLTEGMGSEVAARGDMLEVEYTGWTHRGRRFDGGRLEVVALGSQPPLIPGFVEGLEGMRLNEVRQLVIPHELGYGVRGFGDIPPYATLVFRVQLVGLQKAP